VEIGQKFGRADRKHSHEIASFFKKLIWGKFAGCNSGRFRDLASLKYPDINSKKGFDFVPTLMVNWSPRRCDGAPRGFDW
jgi:hypothetical protein